MPKFTKTEEQLETLFDKWLYVFKQLPRLQDRPKILNEHVFKKLFQLAELAKFSPAETELYDASLKVYRDNKAVMDTAVSEGEQRGFDKGMKKGMKKGKAEGERNKAIEIAKQLLKLNIAIDTIIISTGLSEEEIKKLQ